MEAGACPRPRGGRAASRDTAAAANKNLNLVDVYDIAADIGKVGPGRLVRIYIFLSILILHCPLIWSNYLLTNKAPGLGSLRPVGKLY